MLQMTTGSQFNNATDSSTYTHLHYRLYDGQCRINHGAGGAPAPGPLSSGGLIISQSQKADLGCSVTLLQSLSEFVGMLRERKKFEEFVEMGKELSGA